MNGDDGANWDEVLDKLCWLALGCGERDHHWGCYGWWAAWNNLGAAETDSSMLLPRLLSAAIFLGETSLLVTKLLSQGYEPPWCDDMFHSPMFIAAWTGQPDMVRLLQDHLFGVGKPPNHCYHPLRCRVGPSPLSGAALRGDMDMVRLCLYPPCRIRDVSGNDGPSPSETSIHGFEPGTIPSGARLGRYIETALLRSKTVEVYKYLDSLIDDTTRDPPTESTKDKHLVEFAARGNISVARYLLESGANLTYKQDSRVPEGGVTPLGRAVKQKQFEMVDFLLQQGADPNGYDGGFPGTVLSTAVATGSLAMVRTLLNMGANIHHPDIAFCTLSRALDLKDMAMVELLLDLGVGNDIAMARALQKAEQKGLESMVALLKAKGASLTPWIHPPTSWVPSVERLGPCKRPPNENWNDQVQLQEATKLRWRKQPSLMRY